MKYIIEHKANQRCKDKLEHSFVHVDDEKKKRDIRKQHPQLVHALYECMHCHKIMSSM